MDPVSITPAQAQPSQPPARDQDRELRVADLTAAATCLTLRAHWRVMLASMAIVLGAIAVSSILTSSLVMKGGEEDWLFGVVLLGGGSMIAFALWRIANRPGVVALATLARWGKRVAILLIVVNGGLVVLLSIAALTSSADEARVVTLFTYVGLAFASVIVLRAAQRLGASVRTHQDAGAGWDEGSLPQRPQQWTVRQQMSVAPAQDRAKFCGYEALAWTLFALAAAVYFGVDYLPQGTMNPSESMRLQGNVAQLGGGIALAGYLMLRRGRRVLARWSARLLEADPRAPVLLLRAWAEDSVMIEGGPMLLRYLRLTMHQQKRAGQRLEEVVADELKSIGPVRAIGKPGEKLPELGAIREYVPDDLWRDRVVALMRTAAMIVVVVGRDETSGIRWELSEIDALGFAGKTLVIFPPRVAAKHPGRIKRFIAWMLHRPLPANEPPDAALQYAANILGVDRLDLGDAVPLAAIRGAWGRSWIATIDSKQTASEEAYRIALVTLFGQIGLKAVTVEGGSVVSGDPIEHPGHA